MKRTALLAATLACVLASSSSPRERDFAMPPLVEAAAMAMHDAHAQERVAFAADPYDTPRKASLFHAPLLEHSVLPILVVFTNDGADSVLLTHARFELVTRDRAKAEPYSMDDLRRALAALRPPGSRTQDRLPYPMPGKNSVHGGLSGRDRDELEHSLFAAQAIEPRHSAQGFLFFDVTGLDHPAQGARLFVTGVTDARGHELMYFEVPLDQTAPDQP
jgi:hypothetical protein